MSLSNFCLFDNAAEKNFPKTLGVICGAASKFSTCRGNVSKHERANNESELNDDLVLLFSSYQFPFCSIAALFLKISVECAKNFSQKYSQKNLLQAYSSYLYFISKSDKNLTKENLFLSSNKIEHAAW